jgi:O-antigen/teichoic acid export membrane protein
VTAASDGDRSSGSGQPYRRRFLRNVIFSGFGNGWAIVVTLISLPLMLKGLGATGFGTWVLLLTFSASRGWLSVADLGVGLATTAAVSRRAAVSDESGVARIVVSSLTLSVVAGTVGGAVLAAVGPPFLPSLFGTPPSLHSQLTSAIAFFAVQIPFDLVSEGLFASLEGLQRIDLARIVDATQRTIVAAATVTAALRTGDLGAVAAASLAATVVGAALGLVILVTHQSVRAAPSWREARALLGYGATVALLRGFGTVARTMDRLIVGIAVGPAAVALVEVATQVQNGADSLLTASAAPVLPSASWLRARAAPERLRELLYRGTKYSLLVTTPVIVGAALLARPLVDVWVGHRYDGAILLVGLAMAYAAMSAPLHVGVMMLTGLGRANHVLRAFAVATAINLAASIALVRVMGTPGVFIGSLVGTAYYMFPVGRSILREVGASAVGFLRNSVLPAVVPGAALAAALLVLVSAPLGDIAALVAGSVGGGTLFAAVALRWSLQRQELNDLRRLVRRSGRL